jgi:predicted PurR-regulated permease PerM
MRRGLAIATVYVCVFVVAPVLLGLIVVPPIVNQGTSLATKAPQYANDVQNYVNKNKQLRKLNEKYHLTQKLDDQAGKLPAKIGDAATTLSNIGLALVNSIFAMVNILILSIFLVASGRRWVDRFIAWRRPDDAARIEALADRVARTFSAYIGGALLQAFIAGVTAFVVMEILGVPFAAPLAVLTFFFDLIPLVGATIGAVLVGIVTLFNDFPTATIVWTIFAIVYQQIENSVIQPQIQRRAVEVHAFAVLVGVLCGATLFGILGALLAIPVIASGQIVLREWFAYREELRLAAETAHDDEPPAAAAAAGPPEPPLLPA